MGRGRIDEKVTVDCPLICPDCGGGVRLWTRDDVDLLRNRLSLSACVLVEGQLIPFRISHAHGANVDLRFGLRGRSLDGENDDGGRKEDECGTLHRDPFQCRRSRLKIVNSNSCMSLARGRLLTIAAEAGDPTVLRDAHYLVALST